MENASDALIMAGQVLIFIIALTVCISSFTTVRTQINKIVGQTDEIRLAKDGETYLNYMESDKEKAIRIVGSDTLVSSMTRSVKENYVVYVKLNGDQDLGGIDTITATADLVINGKTLVKKGDTLIKVKAGANSNQSINKILEDKLFDIIKEKTFYEYLGEYQEYSSSGVSTENKEVRRIITYIEKEKQN